MVRVASSVGNMLGRTVKSVTNGIRWFRSWMVRNIERIIAIIFIIAIVSLGLIVGIRGDNILAKSLILLALLVLFGIPLSINLRLGIHRLKETLRRSFDLLYCWFKESIVGFIVVFLICLGFLYAVSGEYLARAPSTYAHNTTKNCCCNCNVTNSTMCSLCSHSEHSYSRTAILFAVTILAIISSALVMQYMPKKSKCYGRFMNLVTDRASYNKYTFAVTGSTLIVVAMTVLFYLISGRVFTGLTAVLILTLTLILIAVLVLILKLLIYLLLIIIITTLGLISLGLVKGSTLETLMDSGFITLMLWVYVWYLVSSKELRNQIKKSRNTTPAYQ